MNRRTFLRLLGLAPLVPIAAKLSVIKGTACGPTISPETVALARGEVSQFMGFRYVETGRKCGRTFAAEQYNELFRAMVSAPLPEIDDAAVFVSWMRNSGVPEKKIRKTIKPRVRPQFSCL